MLLECLPLVLGTGEDAVVHWGFAFVTVRFILLPLAAAAHVVVNGLTALVGSSRSLPVRLVDLASIAVSAGYLALWFARPLPGYGLLG